MFVSIPILLMLAEQLPVYDPLLPTSKNYNREGSTVTKVDRKYSYYLDGRNQIPSYNRIAPPNPENIPNESTHPTRTVEPFESYYDRNVLGIRRPEYMTPIVPNYNRFYSNRRAYPYTRKEFIDVWCTGNKDYEKGTCTTNEYEIYFVRARDWTLGITRIPFNAHAVKSKGKKQGLFIMVDDLGLEAPYMHDAKDWSDLFKVKMLFGTIDSFIPIDWIT